MTLPVRALSARARTLFLPLAAGFLLAATATSADAGATPGPLSLSDIQAARALTLAELEASLPPANRSHGYALRWWAARRNGEDKNWSRARTLLQDLAKIDHPLRPVVLLDLGSYQAQGEVPPAAWVQLGGMEPGDAGVWREQAWARLARWYYTHNRFTEARDHYEVLASLRPLKDSEAWDRAMAAKAAEEPDGSYLNTLLEEGPDPADWSDREALAVKTWGTALLAGFDDLAWMRRARRLGEARRFKTLLRDREARLKRDQPAPLEVLLWEAYALADGGDLPAANHILDVTAPKVQGEPGTDAPATLRGLVAWRAGDLQGAQLARQLTRGESSWAGWALEEVIAVQQELAAPFAADLARLACTRERGRSLLWAEALRNMHAGQWQDAVWLLEPLTCSAARPAQDDRLRALYFLGRCRQNLNQPDAARQNFEEVEKLDRYGYYGYRSRQRLGGSLPALASAPPERAEGAFLPEWLSHEKAGQRLTAFAGLELDDLALTEWEGLRRAKAAGPVQLALAESRYWIVRSKPGRGVTLMRQAWPGAYGEGGDLVSAEVWGYLYPVAETALLRKNAAEERLPLALVAGLIRQESMYDPNAVSRSGALGYMQLMPSTAKWLAKKEKRTLTNADIPVPEENIHLGTRYLRMVLDQFGGKVHLALAGYNAGPGRVKQWGGPDAPDEELWIESIPIEETRGYVRKILLNMWEYNRIRGYAVS